MLGETRRGVFRGVSATRPRVLHRDRPAFLKSSGVVLLEWRERDFETSCDERGQVGSISRDRDLGGGTFSAVPARVMNTSMNEKIDLDRRSIPIIDRAPRRAGTFLSQRRATD